MVLRRTTKMTWIWCPQLPFFCGISNTATSNTTRNSSAYLTGLSVVYFETKKPEKSQNLATHNPGVDKVTMAEGINDTSSAGIHQRRNAFAVLAVKKEKNLRVRVYELNLLTVTTSMFNNTLTFYVATHGPSYLVRPTSESSVQKDSELRFTPNEKEL